MDKPKQLDLFDFARRAVAPGKGPSAAATFTEQRLQQELADVRREVRNLTIMGMRPDLSSEKLVVVRNAERSARAELKLRFRALEYVRAQAAARTNPRKASKSQPKQRLSLQEKHDLAVAKVERFTRLVESNRLSPAAHEEAIKLKRMAVAELVVWKQSLERAAQNEREPRSC